MLADYVADHYPDADAYFRQRVGPITTLTASDGLTDAERGMLGSFRRWVDVVVVTATEVVVVEAKMRSKPDALAQLRLYRDLVLATPELQPFLDRPLALELVVALEDPAVTRLAREFGVRHRVFKPAWLAEWLAQVRPREGRAPRDSNEDSPLTIS